MSVLIVGANGNMGQRYQAIFRYLRRNFECVDVMHSKAQIIEKAQKSFGIIIATPTETHLEYLETFYDYKIPILCEKPLCKDVKKLCSTLDVLERNRTNLSMIYQYSWFDVGSSGSSSYDYFKHGSDGLIWDCIQIIAMAKGKIELKEKSPIWKCTINGTALKIHQMDRAYIAFINQWLKNPGQDIGWLKETHLRTASLAQAEKKKNASN